jgi:mono/diheme cytochrome c family protein
MLLLALLATFAVSCNTWAQDVGNIYAVNCANCHGADGRGNTVLGRTLELRDLRSPEVQRLSEHELLVILSKGAGRGRMPGFQKKLGAETVHQLATYVRDIEDQPVPVPQINKTGNSKTDSSNGDVKHVYSAKCSHCHGADGAGNTVLGRTLKLLDLRSPEAQKFSDSELIAIIASGADGGRMPGFRKKLGPEMVEQLASYVRGLAGKPSIDVTKKAASAETASESTSSEPVKPEVEGKTTSIVQPEKQVQPLEHKQAGEPHKPSPLAKLASAITPARKTSPQTHLVDLNSASKETLMTLPGITEADVASIIGGRPYKSSLQFKARRIVSPETYAKIAGRIVAKTPARTTQQPTPHEDTN